jgi:hypothetical protein
MLRIEISSEIGIQRTFSTKPEDEYGSLFRHLNFRGNGKAKKQVEETTKIATPGFRRTKDKDLHIRFDCSRSVSRRS